VTVEPREPVAAERRLLRLRHELDDDEIRLPDDEDLRALLLTELDYARHPHSHEGVAPRYGALLATPDALRRQPVDQVELVDISEIPLAVARRLADGRSSFVARVVGGPDRLVCFERTREYESSAVHLTTETGALVVQRLGQGWVRLATPHGVAIWDNIQWSRKPLSMELVDRVAAYAPAADRIVLANLLELCTHWLSAGRVGATLVWRVEGDPHELGGIGMQASVAIPPLDLRRRSHFAALLNALAQYDRAALVDQDGHVTTVGVHLRSTERTRRTIPPFRGTRHTSAQRFTASQTSAIAFVVSSSGGLSVFCRGERLDTD
jgi:DNA integrity scanning protein DisA with diadenylate cyclase activity